MNRGPLVDIVVPTYNSSEFLSECLDSLLKQSYKNVNHIIVVDDGSTDSTEKIIKKYINRSNIKVIKHVSSMGVSRSRNDGMRVSTAEYVTFVDSDDVVSFQYIEALVQQIGENILPVVGLTHNKKQLFRSVDIAKYKKLTYKQSMKGILGFGDIQGFSCGKLFDLSDIKSKNIFFNDKLKICEDLEFVLRYIVKTRKVISINKAPFYYYRIHENSALTSRDNKKQLENKIVNEISAYEEIDKLFTNSEYLLKSAKRQNRTKKLWVLNNSLYYLEKEKVGKNFISNNWNFFREALLRDAFYLVFSNFIKFKPKASFICRLMYNLIFTRREVL